MRNFFKRKTEDKSSLEQKTPGETGEENNGSGFSGIFLNEEEGNSKKMSFIEHLEELRKRLLVVMIVFVVAIIGFY
ncbi:MAG: hypothetical protein NTZ89_03325, partial [Actinobacteria bacterium]|nr:hypothetical protein [Actinomycetota bacterium]